MKLATDLVGLVGVIDPDAYTAATYTTGWINMAQYPVLMATIFAGDLGASATVDAKFQQATDGSGTGAKDVTGKAITQLTQAGSDSNKQVHVNLREDELDVDNHFTHARLSVTVGVATSDLGAAVYGLFPDYGFAYKNDLSTVDEIVA